MKVAVITPYYQEPLEQLEHCHRSVAAQTHPCTHLMVADGHPRDEIAGWAGVQHIVLPVSHRDYGNTPRGIGGVSAFNQGFDAVAYLDADNWYAEDHIESLVALCREYQVPVAFSSRQIVLSTGEYCPFLEDKEADGRHIDTSCYFFTREAAFLAPVWALMDPQFAPACDRFMRQVIVWRGLTALGTGRQTLFYLSYWPEHFKRMGKEPPQDARKFDAARVYAPHDPAINLARLGFDPLAPSA